MASFSTKLHGLGFQSYREYLAGEHWKAFKERYRKSRNGKTIRCQVCRKRPVDLHHHTYARLGQERLTDVTPLCREHHEAVHQWLKERGKRVEHTHSAISALSGTDPKPSARSLRPPCDVCGKPRKKKGRCRTCQKTCQGCGMTARRGSAFCRRCSSINHQVAAGGPAAAVIDVRPKKSKTKKERRKEARVLRTDCKPNPTAQTKWADPLQAIRMLANGLQLPPRR